MPAPALPSLERAAATAVARAASRTHGLPLSAEGVSESVATLAELLEILPDGALIAVVEGPAERLGLVALCPAVIASLIEMQAVGRVSARAAPARRATRTDAAIAADFVNLALDDLGGALGQHDIGPALSGFRYASYLDDPRPLGLMLEDGAFHRLTFSLRLGAGGERRGTVLVAVPATLPAAAPPVAAAALSAPVAEAPAQDRPTLAAAIRAAEVPVVAVLCRRTVTLRELRTLQPGSILTLPAQAIGAVQLETLSGQRLAEGRLGEDDGFFALRLTDPREGGATADAGGGRPALTPTPDPGGAAMPDFPLAEPAPITFEPPMADLGIPDDFRIAAADGDDGVVTLPLSFGIG